ncbi:right-handed parallel beta-helix repeat-containing protein, partial [bacterium AH-315-J04]|nr:right-handed parallel beta-helix repeat-containing protein [bacterium AH-315-J04]
ETNGGGIHCQNTSPTISNCVFSGNSATIGGGGMYNSLGASPLITNCSFTNNTANNGGGMFNSQSYPTVINCKFTTNVSAFGGGGMFNSDSSPDVVGCTFLANSANGAIGVVAGGGGMLNINLAGQDSNPTVTRCEFLANVAVLNGGGMLNHIGSNPLISDCVFDGNMAGGNGGGMINTFESLTFPGMNSSVTNCVFNRNFAGISGGGMFIEPLAMATITNCQFTGNTAVVEGGGIFCSVPTDFDVRVTNCTFYENSASVGGGMAIDGGALVTGSIFWNDSPDAVDILNGTSSVISACIIQGALPTGSIGGGNFDADPKFVDAVGVDGIVGTLDDDLRLLPGSPCIDAGRNPQIRPDVSDVDDDGDVTEPIPLDLNGSPRFVDDPATMNAGFSMICPICSGGALSKSDIGAFEYIPGDGDRDGDTDLTDYELFTYCLNGPAGDAPSECLAFDMNVNGQVDLFDWRIFQIVFIELP